ncbi:Protein-lysine methyltransferase METTL21D [Hondaea fermentalgiana]|uniref:Protein-lysine methyltransferase METTL21D n=1 Tax=Hondaea fermentalgiana TaxID=2315210 RepID=A0A2R5GIM8_9STRA|nr:Protein-lysine methyltransferase METTL21D [Hondaea fermentalgiana]|eukprot:GBG30169.1 Protein-lysine methyltransferase METTL21D [Hondaea fermentalgiana]
MAAQEDAAPVLLLGWREFAVNCSRGELKIAGKPLLVDEVANTGEGTGLVVWDGSIVLAKYVEHAVPLSPQARVLELGCGTGVVGLASAALGAGAVYLTDLDYALGNARDNAARNEHLTERVQVFALDWTAEELDPRAVEHGNLTHILAADVIWVPELVIPFADTLARIESANPHIEHILLAHQTRAIRTDEILWAELKARSFQIQEISVQDFHPEFQSKRIKIYRLTRKSTTCNEAS